jgi:hypothetical protein
MRTCNTIVYVNLLALHLIRYKNILLQHASLCRAVCIDSSYIREMHATHCQVVTALTVRGACEGLQILFFSSSFLFIETAFR